MDKIQNDLKKSIEEFNETKVHKLITDPAYWNQVGVTNFNELQCYLVICDIQELQKQIYGSCRPKEIFMGFPLEDLKDRVRYLRAKLKEI